MATHHEKETLKLIIDLTAATQRGAIQLALGIQEQLIHDTPVDLGFAVANWVPSVGTPFSSIAGSRDSISTAQQEAGTLSLLGWKFKEGPAFISNNVEYILPLNAGHSTQAPSGFIELAIQAQLNIANRRKVT